MSKIKKGNLTIDSILLDFVNKEIIPGTDINTEDFWSKFDLHGKQFHIIYTYQKFQMHEYTELLH
jgi:hypothetical protein